MLYTNTVYVYRLEGVVVKWGGRGCEKKRGKQTADTLNMTEIYMQCAYIISTVHVLIDYVMAAVLSIEAGGGGCEVGRLRL